MESCPAAVAGPGHSPSPADEVDRLCPGFMVETPVTKTVDSAAVRATSGAEEAEQSDEEAVTMREVALVSELCAALKFVAA